MKAISTLTLASVALASTALSACSSVGPTAEQLKEMANTQSSMCVTGAAWNGSPLAVHYASFGGKSTGTAGGGGEANCGASTVKFTNEGKAFAPPASAPSTTVSLPINVVPSVKVTQ